MHELGIDPKTQLISIYRNPYSYEIHSRCSLVHSSTDIEYEDWEVQGNFSIPPLLELSATPVEVIDSEERMKNLVSVLQTCRFISVSVMQHRYRSYLGYCSVIMISSPTTDYIVDAIKAHNSCWMLNEVFTNPAILKVMFDASEPLLWLQRDFGVFLVNLIDVQMALTTLGEKKLSFGDVLKDQMGIYINMRYKRADWRLGRRPRFTVGRVRSRRRWSSSSGRPRTTTSPSRSHSSRGCAGCPTSTSTA